jgi:hypothetical protein
MQSVCPTSPAQFLPHRACHLPWPHRHPRSHVDGFPAPSALARQPLRPPLHLIRPPTIQRFAPGRTWRSQISSQSLLHRFSPCGVLDAHRLSAPSPSLIYIHRDFASVAYLQTTQSESAGAPCTVACAAAMATAAVAARSSAPAQPRRRLRPSTRLPVLLATLPGALPSHTPPLRFLHGPSTGLRCSSGHGSVRRRDSRLHWPATAQSSLVVLAHLPARLRRCVLQQGHGRCGRRDR